jgi:sucrose-6-phosphate hydrolase SacC (GH32 family)
MFSGSGVVDWKNTTGFQTGDEPPLICIYTNAGGSNPWSSGKPFTQAIAYSNDRGRTWTKYEGNPVQGHLNQGNRDPKVIWWEETNEWVIVLYLKQSRMAFFRSKDLKRWELQSILQSFHECPELFQLAVDGNEANKKWILYGAAGDYFIGDFDGSKFTPQAEEVHYNYGDAFYASQTFSDIPAEDGRRIQIGWGQVPTPGMPFNQMMTFPVLLTLRTTEEGLRMCANPVKEIEKLYKKKHSFSNENLIPGKNPLSKIKGDLFDIHAELEVGDATQVGFEIRGVPVVYDVEKKTISCKEEKAPCKPTSGKIKLRLLVDRTSIEIFINDGQYYMPMGSIPDDDNMSLKVFAKGGKAKIISLEVNELNSIWQ